MSFEEEFDKISPKPEESKEEAWETQEEDC